MITKIFEENSYRRSDMHILLKRRLIKHQEHAEIFANDPDWYVRGKVAKHPQHAGKLVNDQNSYVREQVAKHPEHAGKLVNDLDRCVSNTAKETLNVFNKIRSIVF